MKIKLSQVKMGNFTVRDDIEGEYLKELKESLKNDGQWDPIIVRPSNGGYEVIAGHTRFQAAKELGWNDIEAAVKDLSDEEADFLALKTNLMRKDMSEIEEGKVLQRIMIKHKVSERAVADKLGKSRNWVSRRVTLVLDIIEEVQKALEDGKISMEHANLISQINQEKFNDWQEKQKEFLIQIIDNNWTRDETRKQLKRFFNQTIFTIGYEGKDIDEFIKILKDNNIDVVIDVRASNESKHKPEFNGKILDRSLKQHNINYEHYPELGIHFVVQEPYKQGYLKLECLEQWYKWNIDNNVDFDKLVNHFKDAGKCVLLCMEKYATPLRNQEYHCHRHVLAEMIMKTGLFSERMDL